jgi:hypothetical protein
MNEPVRLRQEIALIFDSTMLASPCLIGARQPRQDRRALDLRAQANDPQAPRSAGIRLG